MIAQDFGCCMGGHQIDHAPDEDWDQQIHQGDGRTRHEQRDQQAAHLSGIVPIERQQTFRRCGVRGVDGGVQQVFKKAEHGCTCGLSIWFKQKPRRWCRRGFLRDRQ